MRNGCCAKADQAPQKSPKLRYGILKISQNQVMNAVEEKPEDQNVNAEADANLEPQPEPACVVFPVAVHCFQRP